VLGYFYDKNQEPIEVDVVQHNGIILPLLAKRVTSEVEKSVVELTTKPHSSSPYTKVEFRILDFKIAEDREDEF